MMKGNIGLNAAMIKSSKTILNNLLKLGITTGI